jgi:zinc/manganese transport system substrate-binding protein
MIVISGRALAAVALTAVLAGCTGSDEPGGPATSSGDPDACPGEVVDVVVSVGQWSDVARRLGGDCADVTTIVASGAVDPHDFDPGTADLAAFSDADVVVLNGGDYDHWAEDAVATLDSRPVVINAYDAAGDDGDPHVWHSPDVVEAVAAVVTGALLSASPDAGEYFLARAEDFEAELATYRAAVADLRTAAAGRSYAATETVYDRMAAAVGLADRTPEGYRRAVSNDSEPSPRDLAAFEALLTGGAVDVLVYNAQTSGSVPERLRDAAEDAGVPVVEVSESPPGPESSFLAWQQDQLEALTDALTATP